MDDSAGAASILSHLVAERLHASLLQ